MRAHPGKGRIPCRQSLWEDGDCGQKNGFGALPIQRVSADYAGMLLKKALAAGVNFFDTARSYSDSEEKIGLALSQDREKFYLATKTPSTTVEGFWQDLETSLRLLKTDLHRRVPVPQPGLLPQARGRHRPV